MKRNHAVMGVVVLATMALFGWILKSDLLKGKASPVEISTTKEAFVSQSSRDEALVESGRGCLLRIAITPAPWPASAREIWNVAKSGSRVQVTVEDSAPPLKLLVVGVAPSGELEVECESASHATRILDTLEGR